MWPDKRLQDLFGIETPIIQAPMAGSSTLEMALAVGDAGGLGSLACATLSVDELRDLLANACERSRNPFNVNFFTHADPAPEGSVDKAWLDRLAPFFEEFDAELPDELTAGAVQPFDEDRCAVLEALPPAVASFHFGLPAADLVNRIKAAGTKVISSATTVEEALWLAEGGCDAIIAQGYEAGGHRGMFLTTDVHTQIGTMALVPQIADAVEIPVIAAGGIADGRGIAAALALGASGVQIGTAYLFTDEADINPLYCDALQSAKDTPSSLTNVFSGRPARCLAYRIVREIGPVSHEVPVFPKGFSALAPLRAKAESTACRDFSAHYCGQAGALGRSASAAQLTRRLAEDTARRLQWLRDPAAGQSGVTG
ncbi:MAG TPA: nitronate monooxygenase [Afifellaceae bacterium]|nr:nitronate monooxygenase [Afifellaceae bacterium]